MIMNNQAQEQKGYLRKVKKIYTVILDKMIPLECQEEDGIAYWRERILFSILFSGLVLGLGVIISVIPMMVKNNHWNLVFFDSLFWIMGFILFILPRIGFKVRAVISLLIIYGLGLAIIYSVGLFSGGPAWLFCFAVIAGVLLGSKAAVVAICVNAITLFVLFFLITTKYWDTSFPFFMSDQLMVIAGINFIFLNALSAISVSVLVKGLTRLHKKEKNLSISLSREKIKLTDAKTRLENEIKERQLAEQEKIKARKIAGDQEKLALVGQVAGKMAHDFNNILGIIMGNTEISLLDCREPEIKKTLELIFEQTIRGKNLTRNLVAFAKSHELKQEFFRLDEKIDMVLSLLTKDLKGIELIKENAPDIPDLLADSGMIEHALVNLLQNSIHAVGRVEHPRIIVRSFSSDDRICFEIEDNGCGILEEHLEAIFEPSFTLKGSGDITGSYKPDIKGTGYGMSNVKKYIDQHRGDISVESTFRAGTKVTLSLPVIQKELTSQEKIKIQKETHHCGKNILLVEDESAISMVQNTLLTQAPCHHTVDIAANGQAAMELFDKNNYDFISLDFVLTGKINGMEVYAHIRETDKTIPILFVSGNLEFLESIKALKQKDAYIDHLPKPCQNKDYVSGVNRLLDMCGAVPECLS